MDNKPVFEPLQFQRLQEREQMERSRSFLSAMRQRRTVREFSSEPVPVELVENAVRAAMTAPSGANLQPWTFVIVSDVDIKRRIREAAEVEEREFYTNRAPQEWLDALAPLGTDSNKPFIETAPHLIVAFRQDWGNIRNAAGEDVKCKHYYASESIGIACGFLIASLHLAGLATLTHTPSPMGFLSEILGRPKNEKPFLLLPVGYPAGGACVPRITKKEFAEVVVRK